MRQQEERKKKLEIPFVVTRTAKKMLGFLELNNTLEQMGIIYGGAGLGKTSTIEEYAKRNPSTILIEPDMGFNAKVLLKEICRKLGLDDRGQIHTLTEKIIESLRGSGRMIIVDEAELLPLRALESLRRIHDKAKIAVALVGMPKLLLNLKGPNSEFKQLFSRVAVPVNLGDIAPDEDLKEIGRSVLHFEDVKVIELLVKEAKGNIRHLSKLMIILNHLMQVNDRDKVDEELVQHASGYLIK